MNPFLARSSAIGKNMYIAPSSCVRVCIYVCDGSARYIPLCVWLYGHVSHARQGMIPRCVRFGANNRPTPDQGAPPANTPTCPVNLCRFVNALSARFDGATDLRRRAVSHSS